MLELKFEDMEVGSRFYADGTIISMKIENIITEEQKFVNCVVLRNLGKFKMGTLRFCDPNKTFNVLEE